jgi:hypothetical protein
MLARWDIVRVFRPDLSQAHDKFCICIEWEKRWFLYFNSDLPRFRKAREVAVSVENYEVNCLRRTSYIDTTSIVDDLPEDHLMNAINDPNRRHGALPPSIIRRLQDAVRSHGVLDQEKMDCILG